MSLFLAVAGAHLLALLSPGPDFFLIARTALAHGWRIASGACAGIALVNGFFIAAAFSGTALLHPGSLSFALLQGAGCIWLLWLGVLFLRHAGRTSLAPVAATHARHAAASWWRAFGAGALSALLNPKNALFYASLAAVLGTRTGARVFYGLWMFGAVLAWDLAIAVLIGNPHVLRRFARALPWLERLSGAMLIVLALGILATHLRA